MPNITLTVLGGLTAQDDNTSGQPLNVAMNIQLDASAVQYSKYFLVNGVIALNSPNVGGVFNTIYIKNLSQVNSGDMIAVGITPVGGALTWFLIPAQGAFLIMPGVINAAVTNIGGGVTANLAMGFSALAIASTNPQGSFVEMLFG